MAASILQTSVVLHLTQQIVGQFAGGQYAYPQMAGQIPGMQMQIGNPAQMPMMGNHPMPLNAPFLQQRLPMVVMPYHSKTADKKYKKRRRAKRRHYKESTSSSSSYESDSSSKENLRTKTQKHRRKQKRQVLTPVISYMTKNGDVVYQKKVKKENAGDWLDMNKRKKPTEDDSRDSDSQDITVRELKEKYGLKKRHKHKHRN